MSKCISVSVSGYVYKPRRDIPKAIREIKTFSPTKIAEWVKTHRTKKDKKSGRLVQKEVSPNAVGIWIKRKEKSDPEFIQALRREVRDEEIPAEAISEALFENGVFYEVPCIKKWVMDLYSRGAKDNSIKGYYVNHLKRICQGIVRGRGTEKSPYERIEAWGLKHPRQLTLEDAKLFVFEMTQRGYATRQSRLVLRNFLTAQKIVVSETDISGAVEENAGQYADLFVEREKLHEILDRVKELNEEAYKMVKFAYKTATRMTACLNADASMVNRKERTIAVLEKASKGKKKRKMIKAIPDDLWGELQPNIKRGGKLFRIDKDEVRAILRSLYIEVIPTTAPRIPWVFHFWRHMFAQHMLRQTHWNYGLVATLGGWTVQTLERYYGKMNPTTARNLGRTHQNNL